MKLKRKYRHYDSLSQQCLMPVDMCEWLPEDHIVFLIDRVIDALDLSEIYMKYEQTKVGNVPYDPKVMVKILIYGACMGIRSSRKLERAIYEVVGFRILVRNNFPDFRTICEFRRKFGGIFEKHFRDVVMMCKKRGMLKVGTVAIDGTKIKANASLKNSHRMEKLEGEADYIECEIRRIMEEMEKNDEYEDKLYGNRTSASYLLEEFEDADRSVSI